MPGLESESGILPAVVALPESNRSPLPLGAVSGVPTLIQSRCGNKGNFELVTPMASGGLAHYWRNNDDPFLPWFGPIRFGQEAGCFEAVGLIQSNFGDPGNLEVVGRIADRLVFFWRDSGPIRWNGSIPIVADGVPIAGVTGNPVLIQSRCGNKGNFELVTPVASGGLAHYWRNNDDPAIPWHGPTIFGQELGTVGSVSVIERKFGNAGNLEIVAGVGTSMDFLWRDSGPAFVRNGPTPIAAKGISPVLIQSRFGAMGNFEMLAIEPSLSPNGGIVHYCRNNDDSSLPWSESTVFGRDPARQTPIESLTFIQSNFGNPGNFEVIARIGDQFVFFWRNSGPAFTWNGPFAVTAGSSQNNLLSPPGLRTSPPVAQLMVLWFPDNAAVWICVRIKTLGGSSVKLETYRIVRKRSPSTSMRRA